MSIVVQKYGGTSVADPDRIRAVAARVAAQRRVGDDVVVVVSAMGGHTDELVDLAYRVSPSPAPREMDMLLTAGERISISLLCMAIHDLDLDAVSFTGSQAGIVTDEVHGKARIVDVKAGRIRGSLSEGRVAVVAGFQGVSTAADVTTLGRGGSDTTAVALAAALGASVCEIYTDVDGVYTADPRVVPGARKLDSLTYDEMLELSASGAKVLMARSVEFARTYRVPLHVRSSFDDTPGTWVREEESMEKAIISGVAHDASEAKVTVKHVPDRPGIAARVFRVLADEAVNVDMIVQNVSSEGHTDLSFTVPTEELTRIAATLDRICADIGAGGWDTQEDIAKVSLVGAGMKTHPGIAADMFEALAEAGVNIEMISTSTIRISCVVSARDTEKAVRAVHDRFELDRPAQERGDAGAGA